MGRGNDSGAITVLITGSTGGLGEEFARRFVRRGCNVVLVGRNAAKLHEQAQRLCSESGLCGESGVSIQTCVQDLTENDAALHIATAMRERNIPIDVLVNNAGFGYDVPFVKSDEARQRNLMQVNMTALTELCRAFAPAMVKRGSGAILNVASVAGFMAGPYMATYYASKAFVQSFTSALHVELLRSGVHVSALCPGPVRTQFWKAAEAGTTPLAYLAARPRSVVRAGCWALKANKTLCIPGIIPKVIVFATRLVPRSFMTYAAALLQKPLRGFRHS